MNTAGITLADLQGYSSTFRAASRPSFDAVPESEQYTETPTLHGSSSKTTALESLFRSSSLHPTEFLQSPSRRMAALQETHNNHQVAGAARGVMLTRGGSESRLRQTPSRFSNASSVDADANGGRRNGSNNNTNNNDNHHHHHPVMKPLSPMVDMSSFREQNSSSNHVGARKSVDFRRSVSRRREDLARFLSQRGPSQSVDADFEEFARSNSKKLANRPNPYRDYDSRAPSPTPTV